MSNVAVANAWENEEEVAMWEKTLVIHRSPLTQRLRDASGRGDNDDALNFSPDRRPGNKATSRGCQSVTASLSVAVCDAFPSSYKPDALVVRYHQKWHGRNWRLGSLDQSSSLSTSHGNKPVRLSQRLSKLKVGSRKIMQAREMIF